MARSVRGERPDSGDEVDLGVYLSQIASAVTRSHAVEGIRPDLKVNAYPVSVDVAMPTGLVVNELLTNALKHAFVGRDGGTVTLIALSKVMVAGTRQAWNANRPVSSRELQGKH